MPAWWNVCERNSLVRMASDAVNIINSGSIIIIMANSIRRLDSIVDGDADRS